MSSKLWIVMYHYIRDPAATRFPRLKFMFMDDFVQQLEFLSGNFEMATLESALRCLGGHYRPKKDLCLLSFDDGLREHYSEVTELLLARKMSGVFFPVTSCLDGEVAPVHMNHFLTADLGFEVYSRRFRDQLMLLSPASACLPVEPQIACRTYRWDTPQVACFKYLFNFGLDVQLRDSLVRQLFVQHFGSEEDFSRELYFSWSEAREMQRAGMVMGGHSHTHRPLATSEAAELAQDLSTNRESLCKHLHAQPVWPFSYPYGKSNSFSPSVIEALKKLGFQCAFCTEVGFNQAGTDLFALQRLDCKDVSQWMTITEPDPPSTASKSVKEPSAPAGLA